MVLWEITCHSIFQSWSTFNMLSAEQYRALFENGGVPITYLNPSGQILAINAIGARNLGGMPDDFVGRSIYDVLPQNALALRERFSQIVEEGKGSGFEDRVNLPIGERWFWSNVQIVRGGGQVFAIQVTSQDITERRLAQKALIESEARWRSLVQNAPNVILTADRYGKIISVNRAAKVLAPEHLRGETLWDFIHPEHHDTVREVIERVVLLGQPGRYQARGYGADGGECWFDTNVGPIKHDDLVVGVMLVSTDISDRIQAEERLQQSEERYRMIVENAATPIVYHDPDGNVLLINTAGAKNLGGIPCDFVGTSIYQVLSEIAEVTRSRFSQIIASGEGGEFEDCVRLPSGEERWFSSNIQPVLGTDGRALAVQVISLDITERRKMQDARRELSRRLVEVQEAERRHIARELHDQIGQALTGIKLSLEKAAVQQASDCQATIDESQVLINDLIGRVRALSLDLRPPMLDDLGLLPTLLSHFKRYTAQTGVEVLFQHRGLEKRFPPDIETGAYRIMQEALTNVARHAKVQRVTVRILANEERLDLQIKDS
ncbi:MAG: PAS domain S-box protein, partial [Chloroflexi bacterium]|nr:PAS domain S-box protein [Chloroflexota bacterium]